MSKTARQHIQGIRVATTKNKITPQQMADTLDAMLDEGEASAQLDTDIKSNNVVGGIPLNTTYPAGTSVVDIIKDALFSYKAPTASCSGGTTYEHGTSNNITITYGGANSSSSRVIKVELYKDGSLIAAATKTAAGTYTYVDEGVTEAHTYQCKVYDETKGDSHVSASATTTVTFGYKYFGGYAAQGGLPTTSAQVRALTTFTGFSAAGKQLVGNTTTQATAYHLIVCVPDGRSITVQNSLGGPIIPIDGGTVLVHTGGGAGSKPTISYRIWYLNGTPQFKNLYIV